MQNSEPDRTPVFFEDDILTLLELEPNERYAPIERLCATLGLDPVEEITLIRQHAPLAQGVRSLGRDGDGLRVDLIPMWLLTIDPNFVDPQVRPQLTIFQRESASILWQAFKPQGFGPEDALLPERDAMTPADQAYQGMMAQATLSRQQLLIERHIEQRRASANQWVEPQPTSVSPAIDLARLVRRVAHDLAMRTRRNEYGGIFSGLYRQFSIGSYRNMPSSRLFEATEWLERWHGDILGEPEPPPDI